MISIGIDPGKNTGFAVWDCAAQEFIEIMTYDFWSAYNEGIGWWARARMDGRKMLIRVEDPRGHSTIYNRNRGKGGSRVQAKIAQNVGMNKQQAGLLIKGFQRAGIPTQGIVPKSKKWSHRMFKNLSGWNQQTNEHERDAGKLVIGMNVMPDDQYQQLKNEVL
jgi:hypothetical protein